MSILLKHRYLVNLSVVMSIFTKDKRKIASKGVLISERTVTR